MSPSELAIAEAKILDFDPAYEAARHALSHEMVRASHEMQDDGARSARVAELNARHRQLEAAREEMIKVRKFISGNPDVALWNFVHGRVMELGKELRGVVAEIRAELGEDYPCADCGVEQRHVELLVHPEGIARGLVCPGCVEIREAVDGVVF